MSVDSPPCSIRNDSIAMPIDMNYRSQAYPESLVLSIALYRQELRQLSGISLLETSKIAQGSNHYFGMQKGDSSRLASPVSDLRNQCSAGRPVHRSEMVRGLASFQVLVYSSEQTTRLAKRVPERNGGKTICARNGFSDLLA